jgi:hypothetical protein
MHKNMHKYFQRKKLINYKEELNVNGVWGLIFLLSLYVFQMRTMSKEQEVLLFI